MNRRIVLIIMLMILLVTGIFLWGLYLYLTRSSTPEYFLIPEIEGRIEIPAGVPLKDSWVFQPGDDVAMSLVFETKKGTAKGLMILLDSGGLGIVEAVPSSYTMREGNYVWRYKVLGKEEVGRIDLVIRIPEVEDAEYQIRLYYANTNEDPVPLDNETVVVRR